MKNILIAGGTDGIGLAFLRQIDSAQYENIYVLGRNFTQVRLSKKDNVVELACDITDVLKLEDVLKTISEPLDQFVNTIGTFYRSPVEAISSKDVAHHFEVNAIANINLTNLVLSKLGDNYAELLVCSATLAVDARESYALQSATKAAYKYYLDALRKEREETLKVMLVYPSSVNTNVFRKANDTRDTSTYPQPEKIADVMHFMLAQPHEIYIPEIKINNFL